MKQIYSLYLSAELELFSPALNPLEGVQIKTQAFLIRFPTSNRINNKLFSIEFSKTLELYIRLRIRWANRSTFEYFMADEIFNAIYFRIKSNV